MGWLDRFSARASSPPASTDRATDADIRYAYRLLLNREPDEAGFAHYAARIAEGLTLDGLARSLASSDEYHDRQERAQLQEQVAVDLGGYRVVVQKDDPDFGAHLFHWREYEEPVREAIRRHLEPDDTFLDVGANVGVMTFLAASIVGANGRVIAVEPNPDNVQLLYRGLLLNGFANVEVLPLAASDRHAVFSLTGRSNTHLVGARDARSGGHFVQAVPLASTWLGDLPRLDLVKMDVEGHEPLALQGLLPAVTRHRPTLIVEYNPHCLAVQQQDPVLYLRQLFALYPLARALSAFGDDETFDRAEQVVAFWERRAREVTAAGKLPEGLLHFDLVLARP